MVCDVEKCNVHKDIGDELFCYMHRVSWQLLCEDKGWCQVENVDYAVEGFEVMVNRELTMFKKQRVEKT